MSGDTFTQIVLGFVTICGALITAYVLPWIRSKMTDQELDKLMEFAVLAVRCANQIYTPDQWKEKKRYVMEYLRDVINEHLSINITDGQLSCIIEGIVNEVKNNG